MHALISIRVNTQRRLKIWSSLSVRSIVSDTVLKALDAVVSPVSLYSGNMPGSSWIPPLWTMPWKIYWAEAILGICWFVSLGITVLHCLMSGTLEIAILYVLLIFF